ncbi:Fic family protein [Bacillus mycoides]|uniref:Fic family protein n=1 Tax=Bacillus mycoides TaxID=1405 RepID=UPI001C0374C4|nr:Fic family protein [Bacillus mycoides]MED1384296.1 Fic family protein [Bacillus mycoides]QWI47174.1 Fic family protein [Bacillus mycoides]QWI47180.1 Fic family protein [Bacillus mycoides]
MRNFFEETYMNINFKRELIQLISDISEYTGKLSVYQSQKHPILNHLEKTIPLQYMKNFTTMYQDIHVSNTRVKELIINDIPPQTTEEDAVCCYYQTLSLVHQTFDTLSISPETIQELHFQLLHYSTSDSGKWRQKPFPIPGMPAYEEHVSSYRLLPHEQVPQSVKELCEQYNALRANKDMHALPLIARFILNFYCIVPFDQGNGRVAVILLQLLLLQNGYTFIKYICLDKYIKKNESTYYESIYQSSANWYYGEHNISFWLKSFLTILVEAYQDLHMSALYSIGKQTKVERIEQYILQQTDTFTREDIRNVYPDIAESTISAAFASLQHAGHIKLVSKGRTAKWVQVHT